MSKYRTEDIRNLALVGHRASGKTSLADALLFQAHAVDRKGSVDDGSSYSDYDDEEKHHRFSIDTSVQCPCSEWPEALALVCAEAPNPTIGMIR